MTADIRVRPEGFKSIMACPLDTPILLAMRGGGILLGWAEELNDENFCTFSAVTGFYDGEYWFTSIDNQKDILGWKEVTC
jgi:hypothetical protein